MYDSLGINMNITRVNDIRFFISGFRKIIKTFHGPLKASWALSTVTLCPINEETFGTGEGTAQVHMGSKRQSQASYPDAPTLGQRSLTITLPPCYHPNYS